MTVINTNLKSLISQNALIRNNRAVETAMEQLSTGKRINSASDDAAGMAISNRITSQIRGLDQAIRNANDGISLIQTVEGSLNEVNSMLQRMRELSIQSANDTNKDEDRVFMNMEFQALKAEINRIGNNTQWNSTNIMDKSFADNTGEFKFQVGANSDQTIDLIVGDFRTTESTGALASTTTTANVAAVTGVTAVAQQDTLTLGGTWATGDSITVSNATGTSSFTYTVASSDTTNTLLAASLATAANTAFNTASKTTDAASGSTLVFTADTAGTANGAFTIAKTSASGTAVFSTTTENVEAVTAVTAVAQKDTLTLSGSFVAGDKVQISDGTNTRSYIVLAADLTGTDSANLDAIATKLAALTQTLSGVAIAAGASTTGSITLTASTAGTANADFTLTVTRVASGDLDDIHDSDILSQANSNLAIDAIDESLAVVNTARAEMGATINRLTYAADNLINVSQNSTEARSRILDTDFAKASSELARTQIISQAATSVLAQANQSQQSVLKLLQG